jgi:hypothetical protein
MSNLKILVSLILVLIQLQCVGAPKEVSLRNTPNFTFNQSYKYKIISKGHSDYKRSQSFDSQKQVGSELSFDPQLQTIKSGSVKEFSLQEIDSIIEYTDIKQGRQWAKGMGYGALGGVAIGSVILGLALSADNSECEDRGECAGLSAIAGTMGFIGSTILGTLIGLGVGLALPKKVKRVYVP